MTSVGILPCEVKEYHSATEPEVPVPPEVPVLPELELDAAGETGITFVAAVPVLVPELLELELGDPNPNKSESPPNNDEKNPFDDDEEEEDDGAVVGWVAAAA